MAIAFECDICGSVKKGAPFDMITLDGKLDNKDVIYDCSLSCRVAKGQTMAKAAYDVCDECAVVILRDVIKDIESSFSPY